jgi:hydrogenase nickel incorporation protein HypB
MFRSCELVVINKLDLAPHLDVDVDKLLYNIAVVNPGAAIMQVSARTGEGVAEFRDWLQALARAPVKAAV